MNTRVAAILKTLLFTVLVPGFVAGIAPSWVAPGRRAASDALGVAGALILCAGLLVYLRCAWDFAYHGLGTPAPIDPPKVLVSRGLHRFVRNPMYVGVLGVVFGQAAWFHSRNILVYGICLWLAFHLFVLMYEEPVLREKFGESYEEYKRQVPRWLPRAGRKG